MGRNARFRLWMAVFVLLFVLSMDFWNWDGAPHLSLLNIPGSVYYFIFLQLLFMLGFWLFSREFWNDGQEHK